MKVMTVVGTRPEIIRLSRVMGLLDRTVDHVLVHTGQNYDYELNQVFFDELGLRPPDRFLEADTSSLGRMMGTILIKAEEALEAERPDAVLILGDTNSSIAGLIAKRMRIPVFHMEAGNRSFDENVPEEINRRVIDHYADFNLVYTEHGRRNLLQEGIHPRRIYLTGSPMREVLDHYADGIASSDVLARLGLEEQGYVIVSMHREENVDSPPALRRLLDALSRIRSDLGLPVVVSTHPRTRDRLSRIGGGSAEGIEFLKPFGFFDYITLQKNARCAVSDSGTISEEAAILGFPAVTIRNAIERPEAMDTGTIIVAGTEPDAVVQAVQTAIGEADAGLAADVPADYLPATCARRVVNLIVGLAGLNARWAGLDPDLRRGGAEGTR